MTVLFGFASMIGALLAVALLHRSPRVLRAVDSILVRRAARAPEAP